MSEIDEIRRYNEVNELRRELALARNEINMRPHAAEWHRLQDEIARLRDEVAALKISDCSNPFGCRRQVSFDEWHAKVAAEIVRLRAALAEATEAVEAWGMYASEYFQQKHDLAGTLARLRAALERELLVAK